MKKIFFFTLFLTGTNSLLSSNGSMTPMRMTPYAPNEVSNTLYRCRSLQESFAQERRTYDELKNICDLLDFCASRFMVMAGATEATLPPTPPSTPEPPLLFEAE